MAKPKEDSTSQIIIPVNLKLLLRAGREYRPLRLFVVRYLNEQRKAGFDPFIKPESKENINSVNIENKNLTEE
jgi:hypothetical protein